jgi:hypothetical protein
MPLAVACALAPCLSFPDPYASSNIKSGKEQGHGPKGSRSKAERSARKRTRRARRKNR